MQAIPSCVVRVRQYSHRIFPFPDIVVDCHRFHVVHFVAEVFVLGTLMNSNSISTYLGHHQTSDVILNHMMLKFELKLDKICLNKKKLRMDTNSPNDETLNYSVYNLCLNIVSYHVFVQNLLLHDLGMTALV